MRLPRLPRQPERGDDGFTVIEMLVALTIFSVIATAFAFELTGALRVYKESRQRTVAEELATEQLEDARRLDYNTELGTVAGNPPGAIAPVQNKTVGGFDFVVKTRVSFVNDPLPGGFQTGANYKLVKATVTAAGETEPLADLETWIAPPTQPSLNRSVVQVKVADPIVNEYLDGVDIDLRTGPSAPRSDLTDVAGAVTFADLTPNPLTGPTAFYELNATLADYVTHPDSLPPAPAAKQQLSPGQLFPATLHMFKEVGLTVRVESAGLLVPGAKVVVSSAHGTETITLPTGTATIKRVDGKPVFPNTQYTVSGLDGLGRFSPAQSKTVVPTADYRNDVLTTAFDPLVLPAAAGPRGDLRIRVRTTSPSGDLANALVLVKGGPQNILATGRTNNSGEVTVNVPAAPGLNYTVEVPAQLGYSAVQAPATAPPAGGRTDVPTINVVKAPV